MTFDAGSSLTRIDCISIEILYLLLRDRDLGSPGNCPDTIFMKKISPKGRSQQFHLRELFANIHCKYILAPNGRAIVVPQMKVSPARGRGRD